MRRQSVRIFRRREIEPERRTGPDQYEARQRLQMERADSRPEHRQHLRFDDRAERLGHAARSGLRLWRHVLRRPDLEPGELTATTIAIAQRPHRSGGAFVCRFYFDTQEG